MTPDTAAPLFTEDDVIFVYTRADALADGELIDLSALAKSFGFCIPVAVTRRLWADLDNIPASRQGWESFEGRAADMLGILRMAVSVQKSRGVSTDRICFSFRPLTNRDAVGESSGAPMRMDFGHNEACP